MRTNIYVISCLWNSNKYCDASALKSNKVCLHVCTRHALERAKRCYQWIGWLTKKLWEKVKDTVKNKK